MSFTAKSKRWEILHSLWIGWTFTFGFFNWIAFIYVGVRVQRWKWILWGVFYSVPFAIGMATPVTEEGSGWTGDLWVGVLLITWIFSIVHAFVIRRDYLTRLETLQREKNQNKRSQAKTPNQMFPEQNTQGAEQHQHGVNHAEEPSKPTNNQGQPLSSNKNTLIPHGELFEICVKYVSDGYYVDETIPKKKLNNARRHFPIPDGERVVALVDTTILGSSKTGLVICEGGIYWRNDWTTKTNRTFLSWKEFSQSTIESERMPSSTIELAEGSILNLSGSSFKKADATKLLLDIQSLAKTVERNRSKVIPSDEANVSEVTNRAATNNLAKKTNPTRKKSNSSKPPREYTKNEDIKSVEVPHSNAKAVPNNYPIPLTYSYRLVEAEFETLRILKETYRSAEGLTAFLTSLSLAITETPTGGVRKQLLNSWRGKGATFGNWLILLEKTAHHIDREKGPLYRSMDQVLNAKDTFLLEDLHWLMDRRNELHHSDLPVGEETDRLIEEARRRLSRCILETGPLWKHPLRVVLDYDAIRNSEDVLATCLDYSSDHPVGHKVQERYHGVPKKQDLYILQNKDEWITLYPFISIHHCRHCHARETYFVDSWAGPGEEANLRSLERAHEEVSRGIGEDLGPRLGLESVTPKNDD